MQIIESNVKEIIQEPGLEGIYKQIAYGGHICYKSEKVGGEKEFVESLISRGHLSPLEHGTVYLKFPYSESHRAFKYEGNHWSKVYTPPAEFMVDYKKGQNDFYCISTNMRVIAENGWENDLEFICDPTPEHEKRRSFHITCSRSIMDEFVRHRSMSFSCESTRYCNYSKDRFGNELTFVKPYWIPSCDPVGPGMTSYHRIWVQFCQHAEYKYLQLLDKGFKPQEAREVLPLSLKSEFVMTGFENDWKNFFKLRCDKAAHLDAQIVANKIKELLIKQ